MRTAALIAGIVVSVVLLAAAGVLYTLAAGSNAAHYRTTIELVRQSEQLAAAWSVETARVKADPLADFDALAAFLPRMARLTERLSEAALRTPDLPDRLAAEVRGYIAALAAKEERIERFKTGYAVVRNSERFLPLAAAAVSREAQALGEVALASTVATLLQEVSLYLATPSDEAAERLRGELSALREASLAHPPTLANALANLLAHAEVLLERHTPTETLFAEATSNDVSVQADALAQSLAFERARAEARATLYERGMLAAIAVLALFWIGLALQSRARAARAAPAEA
ncbi:MAG: hypothetical protein OXI03_02000, partial [Chloroflexota bacterium]|nr:hypothetical protein [Chloroflexota bacterium]